MALIVYNIIKQCVHPSIVYTTYLIIWVAGKLEPILADFWQEEGYTLD